ncbi:MAG TPA: carboxypeptidase regulatory-like domain-containing protein [Gemmatimonadaceae bacterium]|nr:carboxypeptidase regulatory-like domain-containing protein [Gemmatimonadaceae bacterium]
MRSHPHPRRPHLVLAISFAAFASLGAQNNAPPSSSAGARNGKARILGAVVDSLNGGALRDADILLEGARASTQTDSLGKFEFDSLPPGTFQVGVFHPRLDTLGLSMATRPFRVGPDSTSIVVLAVPSAASIIRDRCQGKSGASGMSAVIGQVKDPESVQPVAGAEVSIAWLELEISKQVGIRQTPHLERDTTDKFGKFTFCGLPSSLQATLQARHGAAATAEIPIALGDRPVELGARTLLLSAADSMAKTGSAEVSGVVTLADGASNAGSRVELVGTDVVALTDARGEFTMRNLPSGSRVLLVRHLGYAPQMAPVDLSSHEEPRVTIKLPKYVAVMDPVLVVARRTAALDKVGFGQRRKSAYGYFIGPEQLERMHPFYATDALRMVPGLRIVRTPQGESVTSARDIGPGCVSYYVDDMLFTEIEPGDVNNFVTGHEIVAVEVYQGGMAPAQYQRMGGGCTTIVLWTRFKAGN